MIRFQLHGGQIGSSLSGPALVAEFGCSKAGIIQDF